jgi:hypothetical protein
LMRPKMAENAGKCPENAARSGFLPCFLAELAA